jgi:hypothetical protein
VQTLAITGAVIVSTPQQVALADARKGINMYTNEKVDVPILGLVENMAWFTPAELPENKYYLFGKEGVKRLAEEMQVPLLGQIPLVQAICESGDEGEPVVLNPDSITGGGANGEAQQGASSYNDCEDEIRALFPCIYKESPTLYIIRWDFSLMSNSSYSSIYPSMLSRMPAATAEPITPATFGPMACINRKF